MNHLIIFSHPNDKSFNSNILHHYVTTLKNNKNSVEVRNLYQLGFNPLLTQQEYEGFLTGTYPHDIKIEQEFVRWSDVITFIFPFWWTGFPAILKGYIDRVFSYGFAYRMENGSPISLLSSKKAVTIFTMGTPKSLYQSSGMIQSIEHIMDISIFDFCGIKLIKHLHFGGLDCSTGEERKEMLMDVVCLATESSTYDKN